MSKQKTLGLLAVAFCLILIFLLKRSGSTPSGRQQSPMTQTNGLATSQIQSGQVEQMAAPTPTPPTVSTQNLQSGIAQMKQQMQLWHSPLLFYGKVVDESNQPIAGVTISYSGNGVDESLTKEIRNQGTVLTDQQGIFQISGLYGIGLMFQLSHPEYYAYPDNSTGFDVRSPYQDGSTGNSMANARIFRMHHKGRPTTLIYWSGGFHAANDGTPASYPLRGRKRADILGQLQIKGWAGLRSDPNNYDWKIQLTLPNGGIIESTNDFDFVAPESRYANTLSFQVSGNESLSKTFFFQLPAGYIRFKLLVVMNKDMFVSGDYYFNPDGSRNLEAGQIIRPTE
ncbi:MAG TPA: hypothetical protein VH280_16175 [Verrucomicrobiae bacterium]|jgi:hypothetical protein|nr:hypothetical protein [Verrucomicrobiae bacterium]